MTGLKGRMEWERGVETLLNPSRKLFNSSSEPHGLTMISIYAYFSAVIPEHKVEDHR